MVDGATEEDNKYIRKWEYMSNKEQIITKGAGEKCLSLGNYVLSTEQRFTYHPLKNSNPKLKKKNRYSLED